MRCPIQDQRAHLSALNTVFHNHFEIVQSYIFFDLPLVVEMGKRPLAFMIEQHILRVEGFVAEWVVEMGKGPRMVKIERPVRDAGGFVAFWVGQNDCNCVEVSTGLQKEKTWAPDDTVWTWRIHR